jgi:hypothetical protein
LAPTGQQSQWLFLTEMMKFKKIIISSVLPFIWFNNVKFLKAENKFCFHSKCSFRRALDSAARGGCNAHPFPPSHASA